MIIEKILEHKKSKIKATPCNSNRASELGHPCLKYLVLSRLKWQEQLLTPLSLQLVFDEGRIQEQAVIRDMLEAGIQVIEQQRFFEWREYQITGHIDGKILLDGQVYPFEVKSMAPYIFNSINSFEDMKKSKVWYIQKYPVQMCLYLILDNKERGLFILKNKVSGELKEIWVDLDYELTDEAITKAEKINEYVAKNEIPEKGIDDEKICPDCKFYHICLPPVQREALEFVEGAELIYMLERYEQLKPLIKEYDEIYNELKERFKEKTVVIGNWLITGKWIERKGYVVPDTKYWKMEIKKIEK
mgnify:CR=1 FL=1